MNDFEKDLGIYIIIKLIFETVIIKLEYIMWNILDDDGRNTYMRIIEDI